MSDPVTVEKYAMGQSVHRLEDPHLLQGLGRYSDDVNLPRQVYAVAVRPRHANARVRDVDASAALRARGALAVLTGDDFAADGLGNLPTDSNRKRRDGSPAFTTPRPALIRGRVRHVGDPLALVVAETPEQAVDAAALVAVDYEPLPAVAEAVEAKRLGAPAGWGEAPDNVAFLWEPKGLGRQVKWTTDRREGFVTDEPGRESVPEVELALDAGGKFLALRVDLMVNIGAYLTPRRAGPATNNVGGVAGVYTTPAI